MGGTSTDAISRLYHEAATLHRRFAETNAEIQNIGDVDSRAADLKARLETFRVRIRHLHGLLGVHGPDVSPSLGELIAPDGIDSSEYRRKYLTLEEVFGALAEGLQRKPTAVEFYSFVTRLNIHELYNAPYLVEADVLKLVATWPDLKKTRELLTHWDD